MKFFLSVFLILVFAVIGLPSQGLTPPITYIADLNGLSESPHIASPGTGSATGHLRLGCPLHRCQGDLQRLARNYDGGAHPGPYGLTGNR